MLVLKVLLACLLENKGPVLINYNWTLYAWFCSMAVAYCQSRTHHHTTINSYLAHKMVICPGDIHQLYSSGPNTHHRAHELKKYNTVA
jgi:hypothetical protein